MNGILNDEVKAGDVVVIRYEGPKGGPGMQEMLYPTSYLKSKHLDKACALITDGRFSGGTSGLSIGHISPEAAAGGALAIVRDGDLIEIDIPARTINLLLSDPDIAARLAAQKNFEPAGRKRTVPKSLQAYARFVSSADQGAVRILYFLSLFSYEHYYTIYLYGKASNKDNLFFGLESGNRNPST